MADPLSVAAGVVGIVAPALHGTRLLLNDIQNIINAPRVVTGLEEDLNSVCMVLEALHAVRDSEWESLGKEVSEGSKLAINLCEKTCRTFRKDLQRWTKHSGNGKLSWLDRANVGFFKQERIRSLSEQLQNCKVTVSSTVTIATLHSSIHHGRITEDIRQTMISKKTEITETIGEIDKRIASIQNRLEEVSILDPVLGSDDNTDDKHELCQAINDEREALEAARKVQQGLLLKNRGQTEISVKHVRASEGGKVVTGLVNAQGKYATSSITIDGVEATGDSQVVSGIVEGVNVGNFF